MARLVLLALLLVTSFPAVAQARKVLEPTASQGATLVSGSFEIAKGTQNFSTGSAPGTGAAISGATLTGAGVLTAPLAGLVFPTYPFPDQQGQFTASGATFYYTVTDASVQLVASQAATGLVDPLLGNAALDLTGFIKVKYKFDANCGAGCPFGTYHYEPTNCTIGTSEAPLRARFTTGPTAPPAGPNVPAFGTPYDDSTGRVTLIDNAIALPASSPDCDPNFSGFRPYDMDNAFGLPSPGGRNLLALDLAFTPIAKKGIVARFEPSPATGTGPLAVTLDAVSSTIPAGVQSAAWDFNGDGATDSLTAALSVSHTFAPGTHTVGLRLTDADGDVSTATRTVSVSAPAPVTPPTPVTPIPTVTSPARVLSSVRASPKTFRRHRGTTISYVAPRAGTTTLTIARKVGARFKRVGKPRTRIDVPGLNQVKLKTRRYKPGRYRVTLDPGGGAPKRSITFRVKP